ncbi:MAG: hypothetical protein OXF09_02385, partial [Hyphomicrobiales bacterium]|nr:hypothetical protein [Hyphomicrobiales bacterium]
PNLAALFNIHVQEDVPREAEEVVDITLSAGENFPDDWIVHGDAVYRLTIPSEDSNVRFRTPTSTTKEDSSEHSVQVEVRPPASEDLTFTIAHAGTVGPDTASGDDYSLQSDTLTIKAGESSGNFKVSITNDSEVENDETIVFELSGEVPTGYTIGRSRHTLTIEDNDKNTVGFDVTSASVEEGEKINLRIKLKDSTDAAITLLDNNLPLSIVVDGNDDHDVEFAGGFTLLTPSSTLTDGVFEMAIPVLAVADEVVENAETVTFTLNEAANFPDNYVIDSSVDTFTLTINANGQATSSGMIQFAQTEMLFREPYPGESTGVPQEIRNVLADDCANTQASNCVVYYFDLDITGVPDQAFDITIGKYSLLRGNFDLKTLGLDGLSDSEWGYPMRHRVTPEDARDGKTRVPIAIARDSEFEPTEYWGLELRTNGLPSGWSLGQQEDVLVGVQDSTGGQVWFAPNDADNGVETFNHSIINEGETVKVRIAANQVGTNDTPLSVSIEGHSGQGHPDIIGAPYNVTLERNTAWVDMEITARNDDIGEGDENYTLVVNQGPGWQDHHGRRIDPERSRYTFTIPANDGPAPPAEGVAQFSEWTLSGAYRGLFAQLSSTTAEGGVVQGAIVLNAPAPEPDGLNFILKVEPGHENDVFLTNVEPARSSLTAGDIPGEYKFNIKSGRVNSADNLAALFNIHVVDDALVEEAEEIDISILPGPGVPYYWTVRGETPYRLTVPADTNDTDNHTIAWETQTSVLDEDNTELSNGITIKLLIDDPLASNTAIGMDVPDTIAIANVANGNYDADARALTINANADEVTLTIVSSGDITGHATAVLEIEEFVGTRALPAGWGVSESVHKVTVEDNDRTLRFARSELLVGEGENATVELYISPPLVSSDISVPLLLVGDADAYSLGNLPNFTTSMTEGEERNATVTVASNRNRETNLISLSFGSFEDADRLDDTVTISIDANNLPTGYALGSPSTVKVNITDDDKKTIAFVGVDGRTDENSGQAVSIDLQISPPLEPREILHIPLKITGDADAYTLTMVATNGGTPSPLEGSAATVTFAGSHSTGPDSFTLTLTPPHNDNDLVFDVVNVEIDRDNLQPGITLGDKSSWRVEIPDDQLRKVSFSTDRLVGYEAEGGGHIFRIFVHPPLPLNEAIRVTWDHYGIVFLNCHASHPNCVPRDIILWEEHTGAEDIYRISGGKSNSHVNIGYGANQDPDQSPETITLTIGNSLPPGFAVGKIPTFTFFIHDDD